MTLQTEQVVCTPKAAVISCLSTCAVMAVLSLIFWYIGINLVSELSPAIRKTSSLIFTDINTFLIFIAEYHIYAIVAESALAISLMCFFILFKLRNNNLDENSNFKNLMKVVISLSGIICVLFNLLTMLYAPAKTVDVAIEFSRCFEGVEVTIGFYGFVAGVMVTFFLNALAEFIEN